MSGFEQQRIEQLQAVILELRKALKDIHEHRPYPEENEERESYFYRIIEDMREMSRKALTGE